MPPQPRQAAPLRKHQPSCYLFLDAGDRPQSPQAYFPGTDLDGRKEQGLSRTLELTGEDTPPPIAQSVAVMATYKSSSECHLYKAGPTCIPHVEIPS